MSWLAMDIGGANLKAADGAGFAATRPFALWRAPELLASELASLIASAPPATRMAVTMTGELADCFPTKVAGVRLILAAVAQAAANRELLVYLTDGRLVPIDEAFERPWDAAASNWHAMATFANRFVPSWPALLIDMGSTTTDVIPLNEAGPCPAGRCDVERLISNELVYTGVQRTPINVLLSQFTWRGRACPLAAELFATTADAYTVLDELSADPGDCNTADGRPKTAVAAHARLARMICADSDSFSMADANSAALEIKEAQLSLLESAVRKVASRLPTPPTTLVVSGEGEFLLQQLLSRFPWKCQVVSLSRELGPIVSQCAPAHALAVLARKGASQETA
jgi:probable H4MPT-linked C1 transfer pathway protein